MLKVQAFVGRENGPDGIERDVVEDNRPVLIGESEEKIVDHPPESGEISRENGEFRSLNVIDLVDGDERGISETNDRVTRRTNNVRDGRGQRWHVNQPEGNRTEIFVVVDAQFVPTLGTCLEVEGLGPGVEIQDSHIVPYLIDVFIHFHRCESG